MLCLLLGPAAASAERGLIQPSAERPAVLSPGEVLSLLVEVATGLTPPPGIQEERAHRTFGIALCAQGIDLGGGARRCFPLAIRLVRPLDAASLLYRVEAQLPLWLAPSRYDLALRFPGGSAEQAGAVRVRQAADEPALGSPALSHAGDALVLEAGSQPMLVRLHVTGAGIEVQGAPFRSFPLPHEAAGFAPGFVALISLGPSARAIVTKRQENTPSALRIGPEAAEAGRPVLLRAEHAPRGSRLFWWLGPTRAGLGSTLQMRFLNPGAQRVQLLAVTPDGRATLTERALPIWQHRAHGCGLGSAGGGASDLWCCVGLLVLSRSWTLRPRLRQRRRGAC